MRRFRLPRTGDTHVVFRGALVGSETTRAPGDEHLGTRWHELALYRGEHGRYVLSSRFVSTAREDAHLSRDDVVHAGDLGAFRDYVFEFDPVPQGVGPLGGRGDKGKHLREVLTAAFDNAVSRLYALLPEADAELEDEDQ